MFLLLLEVRVELLEVTDQKYMFLHNYLFFLKLNLDNCHPHAFKPHC